MLQGSTWNIWDFHLHTPYSVLNNQFGDPEKDSTWDSYVEAIDKKASEIGIVAIGVTDYFTIEGYKKLRQYQGKGHLQNLLLFPNIEFRIDKIIYRSKDEANPKRLNVHVIFDPDLPIELIEEHFLHDLDFIHENHAFERAQTRKLKISNLEEFGNSLLEHESKFEGSPFKVGCLTAQVQVEQIKQRLEEDGRFQGKYLLVLANEDLSLMDWGRQDHAVRQQLVQMSHALFSSNFSDREFCLGYKHLSVEKYLEEFKTLKPCIWGCDSHGFEQRFLKPDEERYCWVKGEVTWEGLKQILYEPEARVRVQSNSPESPKSFYTLKSIQVKDTQVNSALRIDDANIQFNPNLVAIIGGRGSGKTALLDLISMCFPEGVKLAELENSFYYRLYVKGKRNNKDVKPIPILLRLRSGDEIQKEIGNDKQIFEQSDILYLTQNHMEDYTANPTKLYEHIIDLVFDQKPEKRQEFDELQEEVGELQRRIQSINLEIEQLRAQVESQLGEEQQEHTLKQGELADYQNRLGEQVAQQADSGKETVKLTDNLKSLKSYRDKMIGLRERMGQVFNDIELFYKQYKHDAQSINQQLTTFVHDTQLIKEQFTAFPVLLRILPLPLEIERLFSLSQSLSANIKTLQTEQPKVEVQISKIETDLGELQGIDRTIAQLRRTIDNITNEIEVINEHIKALQEKEKRIQTLDSQRIEKFADLMQKTVEQRVYLQKIIDQFEMGQDDLLTGLSFSAVVETIGRDENRDDYLDNIMEKLDGRTHSHESVNKSLSGVIENIIQLLNITDLTKGIGHNDKALALVQQLHEWGKTVRLKRSESEFFNALFSPFFHIGLHIEFNDRPLEALSMGERAIVLLKILLGLDDKPLLIDQPEEHLDNRYIYDELMPAFRNAKNRRQIIIATHNANLVVNTDAEQVIIAEHKGGSLSYQVGTLEDLGIRESIKAILEGGDQAFKKREEKYGYRF